MEVNQIIAKLGGIRPTASKLGIAVSTVQGWKERGRIPVQRLQQIQQILGIELDLPNNTSNSQDTETQKTVKIDKNNSKTIQNNKKPRQNVNFLTYFALVISILSLGLATTADLWRGYVFPQVDKVAKVELKVGETKQKINQIEQKIIIIGKKIGEIAQKSQNSLDLSQYTNNKISSLEQSLQLNSTKIAEVNKKITKVNQRITGILETNNEKLIKIRQITTVALAGADYSLLLNDIVVNTEQQQQALQILQQNQTGIYTKAMLLDFVNNNILQLSSSLHMDRATEPLQKLIAKLNSVVYVRKSTSNNNDVISRLINSIGDDNIDGALSIIGDSQNHSTIKLKRLLTNRQSTIKALKILNNWSGGGN